MKKILSILFVCILSVSLVACGNSSNSSNSSSSKSSSGSGSGSTNSSSSSQASGITTTIDKPVTITFWHAMTGNLEKALQKEVSDFESTHPNIKVNLVNQGSYKDLSQKLMAAAKAHNSPVMAQAYEDWQQQYINNNLITELSPYINDKKYGITNYNDIVQVFRDENTFNGKVYGLPFNKSTEILFYNTDMFKANNIANPPATWTELRADAEKLTNKNKKIVGMGFENSVGLDFPTWVKQAGGQFVDTSSDKVLFNSPEGKTALTYLNSMIQDGVGRLAGADNYMSNPFGRGDVGMYIGSSAGIPFVASAAKGNIHYATAPLPKDKKAATQFQGTNLVIFNSATDQQKLAAWELMKYLTDKAQTIYWAQQTGYVPVRTSALNDSSWKSYIKQNPAYAAAEQQFSAGYYYPHVPGSTAMKNAISKDISDVLLGTKTVDQGLKAAATDAQSAIDQAK